MVYAITSCDSLNIQICDLQPNIDVSEVEFYKKITA